MAQITFKGQTVVTVGNLPKVGSKAPSFTLVRRDLSEASLHDFSGKKIVMNIFPSLDTKVCGLSVRHFYQLAVEHPEIVMLNISMDLPFAMERFCSTESLPKAEALSAFRSTFGKDYGVLMVDGPLRGLLSRAVVLVDEQGTVVYHEQVPEITQEPNYEAVADFLGIKVRR